ncbi:sporulation phosphorelay system protein KapB [Marinococcus halophilus]|uniref:sporulation phosphorelay system protein KapB n=1 Tax=Marinococcus halophilus TaxID=1371 RepID=UPI0009A590CD|nr:sporulation phosphorelay system protein KapB [Marinococcus halophilus]
MEQYRFPYKSGIYVGIPVKENPEQWLMEVQMVLEHPKQGDLHQPKKTNVPIFHERRALAEKEKIWVQKKAVKPIDTVPDMTYKESLRQAFNAYEQELESKEDEFSQKSLKTLRDVKTDYERQKLL